MLYFETIKAQRIVLRVSFEKISITPEFTYISLNNSYSSKFTAISNEYYHLLFLITNALVIVSMP
jgi:hypothetical protein